MLGLWYAWSLVLSGSPEAAVHAAQQFEQAAVQAAEQEGWCAPRRLDFEGQSAAVRSTAALQSGDLAEAGRLAHEATRKLSPSDLVTRNLMDQQLSAVHLRTGNTQAARELLPAVVAASRKTGRPRLYISALQRLAYLHVLQGRLHDADRAYRQLIDYAAAERLTIISAPARLYYANNVLREWDRLEDAEGLASSALADCARADIAAWIVEARMILGRILADKGDSAGAATCFLEAEHAAGREANPELGTYLQSWQVREEIRAGEIKAVRRWIRSCGLDVEDDLQFDLEKDHLIFCAALIAVGELEAARQMLGRIERAARKAARWYRVIEALLLQAHALAVFGAPGRARERVVQAIRLAEPHDFRRIFINAGQPVLEVLGGLADEDSEVSAFVRGIVGGEDRAGVPVRFRREAPDLTAREREILALLAAGLGNAEIAKRLQIGLNTVRWHNRNIYAKLGASNRTQAAAQARDRDLLD